MPELAQLQWFAEVDSFCGTLWARGVIMDVYV
jgi:hypothetical protein